MSRLALFFVAAVLAGVPLSGVPDASAQQGSIGLFPMPPPLPGHTPPRQGEPQQPARPAQPPPPRQAAPQQPSQPPPDQPPPQRQPPQRQAAGQSFPVTIHGTRVLMPVGEGHCGLDERQAFDKGILDAIRSNVGSSNLLLAVTMDCAAIVASRAGQSVGAFVYSYQTLAQPPQTDLTRIDRAAAAQRVCQQAMQSNETPTQGRTGEEKAAELDALGRNGQPALAVLQTKGPACYIGQVRTTARDDGGTTVVSEVVAITIARGRIVIMSLNSVNADTLPQLLPRAEMLVQQLFVVNGARL